MAVKKIVRLRQLTLTRYKRIYRVSATNRCRTQLPAEDTLPTDEHEISPYTHSLHALTSFVIDERNIRQRARARNFLWWLVPTDTTYQN
jgi:hypothetical protein